MIWKRKYLPNLKRDRTKNLRWIYKLKYFWNRELSVLRIYEFVIKISWKYLCMKILLIQNWIQPIVVMYILHIYRWTRFSTLIGSCVMSIHGLEIFSPPSLKVVRSQKVFWTSYHLQKMYIIIVSPFLLRQYKLANNNFYEKGSILKKILKFKHLYFVNL